MAAVIEHEPCYIYHVRDFQEHSQIIEALSLNYGALAIVVNNGKRTNSSSQGLFQPFTPLKLSLKRGRGDLYYLTDYDCSESGYVFPLPQHFCAVYINELLHHLYKNQNQDVKLFGAYVATLESIKNKDNIEQNLRLFELTLLESMGYALTLRDDEGVLLQKDSYYRFCFGAGFFKVDKDAMNAVIANEESLKLASDHQVQPSSTYQAPSNSNYANDSDSGMMFPKSKVRGRRLESRPSFNGFNQAQADTSDAYLFMAMRNGFVTEEYLQRYQELSHDFMGPVLSGEQISDIVRCDFLLNDSVKLAKQLTSALIERLLNGKEIVSRRLYREYAQMRNAKVRALKQAQQAQKAQQAKESEHNQQPKQAQPNQQQAVQESQQLAASNKTIDLSQHQQSATTLAPLDSNQEQITEPNKAATSLADMQLPSINQVVSEVSVEPVSKQLFFEAHPQATTNSKSSASVAQATSNTPYISQFDFVHKCVPRDKNDAPEFLTEYLNLAPQQTTSSANVVSHAQATASSIAPQNSHQTSCAIEETARIAAVTASIAADDPDVSTEKLKITTSDKVDAVVTKDSCPEGLESVQLSQNGDVQDTTPDECSLETKSTAEAANASTTSNRGGINASQLNESTTSQEAPVTDIYTEKARDSEESLAKLNSTEQSNSRKSAERADDSEPVSTIDQSNAYASTEQRSDDDEFVEDTEIEDLRCKESIKHQAEVKTSKSASRSSKRQSAKQLEADKAKAALNKEAQKAKLLAKKEADKAKAAAKKEAERVKALAKKEADKLKEAEKKAAQKAKEAAAKAAKREAEKAKAAAKREAEKTKLLAKKEAEKAKALAKKEAAKRKEIEKKAALKAKQAEAKALLKQQAKEKAKAEAEAKEAQIEREFAHSMLAMIDSGLKKRKRQEVQEDD